METYRLYSGERDGTPEIMAIAEREFIDITSNPADYFLPHTTEVCHEGKIEITGDTHLLDSYFSVRG